MSETTELIAQQILNGNINKRTWGDILYNVKVWGAIGDGIKNDTAAVQATIDYAVSVGGKAVFFPHGTYNVTALTGVSSVVLFGDNASFVGITDTISQIGKPSSNLVYNVKDYGAIGDGTTNDTTDIQAAITAAALVGGSVYFPDGTYSFTQLTISNSVRLISFGKATLKQLPNVGSAINISGTGLQVYFDNLHFDGNNSAQVADSNNSIIEVNAVGTLTDPMYIRVTNCEFNNQCLASINSYSDLGAGTGQEYLYVDSCQFYGGNEGTSTTYGTKYISVNNGGHAVITNCIFDLQRTPTIFGTSGITIMSTDPLSVEYASVIIENNEFRKLGRYASNNIGVVDFYIYAEQLSIKGNKFYESYCSPIKGKTNSKSVVISGNLIDGTTSSMSGINLNPGTYGTTEDNYIISDNIIKNIGSSAIVVDAMVSDFVNRITISNNIIDTCTGRGIYINRTNNCICVGNQIYNVTQQGIWMNTSTGEHIYNNNIVMNTGSFGIYVDSSVTDCKVDISHNHIKAPTKFGIYANLIKSLNIIGNTIDGVILDTSQVGINAGNVTETAIIQGNQVIGQANNQFVLIGLVTAFGALIEIGNSWNREQFSGTAAPTTGTWAVGDKVHNSVPAASGYMGWVCTTAGTPGTWKGFGLIQA